MRPVTASTPSESRGISWFHLVPVALLAWWTIKAAGTDQPYLFIDGVNLAFHEAGHVFLRPFGRTLHVLGGTILQLLVPALLVGYFLLRQHSPFSAAVCAWWLGENFINVAVYMADAREMKLDLVGGGEHDWTQLFYQFGLLDQGSVALISSLTHLLGVVVMLAGLAWMTYFALPPGKREEIGALVTGRFPKLGVLFEE